MTTEKSVPVSIILEEATDVACYMCQRIADCRAGDANVLVHGDFWIARSGARLNSLMWVLSMTDDCHAEATAIDYVSKALTREWRKVRAATGVVSINWD